jgi:hypothetical protein
VFGVHQQRLREELTVVVVVLVTTVPNNKMTKIVQKLRPILILFSMSVHLHILPLSHC